ncbi:hypothetical protein Q5762_05320 [Streptomyces sp. P9(2023)]|uniref:hypothetical protein n=1 Tax=Streptomyces sp. P9(2023) TaxID=3064394 RepID=UPI0028F4092C|nr:hypothetical protein [Streptomyces sp. P9(2023)]MDT9687778.1 hypothetical protein [Streptomyces sp. P9(2023)]
MATSGRTPRPSSPVGGRALALLLTGLLFAGCSSARSGPDPTPDRPTAPAPRTATPTAPTALTAACEVDLPAAWRSALDAGELRAPAGERAVLTDTGPGWTVVQLSTGDRRRAALVRGDGARRILLDLADPVEHQLLAADFDGRRWAAFAVLEGRTLDSPWSLYVWDAETGTSRRLARADLPGPLPQPVVRDGTVHWAQGVGDGRATVYAAAVTGGAPRALRTGVMDAPFVAGGLLVWRESAGSGTRLAAVSLADGRPATPPGPLAALRDIRAIVSDGGTGSGGGGTWAWVEGETAPRLMVWRSGDARPTAVVTTSPAVDGMDQIRISGRLVTWRTPETSYALDLEAGSYARITPAYGYAQARGGALAVAYSLGNAKASGSRPVIQVVDAGRLPGLPRCG